MMEKKRCIRKLEAEQAVPYDLLELVDPSREQIESYLETGSCYVASCQDEVVAVMVLFPIDKTRLEIKNIAVRTADQRKGYGKALLTFATQQAKNLGYEQLLIGTGNSSIHQLALYQKQGFDILRIERNFFLKHYTTPIVENGIPCKHLIILAKSLVE